MAEENGRAWSADVKDLGDKIVALTVAKAVELGDYMEEVHKIKPAASAVAIAPGAGIDTYCEQDRTYEKDRSDTVSTSDVSAGCDGAIETDSSEASGKSTSRMSNTLFLLRQI